jgi:hypothetical protein
MKIGRESIEAGMKVAVYHISPSAFQETVLVREDKWTIRRGRDIR